MLVPRTVRKRSTAVPALPNAPSGATQQNEQRTDAEKVDRLVPVVLEALSPVALVRQAQTCAATAGFTRYLAQHSSVHVARVLEVPQLRARCKNVALLSSVLLKLAENLPWIASTADCRVAFAPAYVSAVTQPLPALLEPHNIVYVENVPPACKTQVDAVAHIQRALLPDALVLGVYEPTRSGYPPERPANWIAGRAFFVLSDASAVQALTSAHPWDLTAPSRTTLRCLALPQWLDLKAEYLALQRKRKAEDAPAGTQLDAAQPWYRGTILTLPLDESLGAVADVPKSLKATLEKAVPESVSYIHTDEARVFVRTAHPRLAQQLLDAAPAQLTRMDADAEDTYWQALAVKTRNQAHKRATALNTTL